jgi:dihydrofolate reductase
LIVSLIVAYDNKRGIGKDNAIPWHLSLDLKRFKRLTMGHHVIMGKKTWSSIGRVLPGRKMVVISHSHYEESGDLTISHSLDEALNVALSDGDDEAFIIGGGEIFSQSMDRADCLYVTEVMTDSGANIFFPCIEPRDWRVVFSRSYPQSDKDEFASRFNILVRKKSVSTGIIVTRLEEVVIPKLVD